jgi:hypothetical protein
MRWYVSHNGETKGPYTEENIMHWAQTGQLFAGMQLKAETGGPWMPVAQSPFAAYVVVPQAAAAGQAQASATPPWAWILAAVLGAFCLLYLTNRKGNAKPVVTTAAAAAAAPAAPAPEHDKIGAWVMAQQFVKDGLKSPGSADFGSVFGEYQKADDCVTDLGDGKYQVRGWVDAQNAFGATLRSNFTVTLKYVGGGNWQAVSGPTLVER